jgi:hypothetical protein
VRTTRSFAGLLQYFELAARAVVRDEVFTTVRPKENDRFGWWPVRSTAAIEIARAFETAGR